MHLADTLLDAPLRAGASVIDIAELVHLAPGTVPTWLDFDATGDHLLFIHDGVLYRRSLAEAPVKVGTGIAAADW